MSFLDREKERLIGIKRKLFSPVAQQPGVYKGAKRDFALQENQAHENLYRDFREPAQAYFRDRSIPWHAATSIPGKEDRLPTNHFCSSQIACVNMLWPFVEDAGLLERVFGVFFPQLAGALPMEADAVEDRHPPYMSFEWIGVENYLHEVGDKYRPDGERQRGALATSADFAFRFKRHDGRAQVVLGEWKYTESYSSASLDNPTRRTVYRDAYDRWLEEDAGLPEYGDFFYEPFYQLMRMTLLAQEMEKARTTGDGEMGADVVSVALIAPLANTEYLQRITSDGLKEFGRTVPEAWGRIAPMERFTFIAAESLIKVLDLAVEAASRPWADYLQTRYGWWK